MTSTIDLLEVNMPELAKQIQAGDTVIITDGGQKKPIMKIEAIAPEIPHQRLGFLKHLNLDIPDSFFFDPLPEGELRFWEGETE